MPAAETSMPKPASIRSAGPLTGFPAISGLTAATGAAARRSVSRTPGRARIGPMLTIGLLGGRTIRSAAAMASHTPGAGRAVSMWRKVTAETRPSARRFTKYS